jgi:hypothetical protein
MTVTCGSLDFTVVGSEPNGATPYGYGFDITRTVCVGEPSAEIRQVHDIVRQTHEPPHMIEDTVTVTEIGGRRLNNTAHGLYVVE